MRKSKERGAIVVEATISLTAFVFLLFTILSLINICYIQAKMAMALNSATKEISQYSYLYYKLGIDDAEKSLNEGTSDAKNMATGTIDTVGIFVDAISGVPETDTQAEFEALTEQLEDGVSSADSLIQTYGDKLADDPKGFLLGMGKMALNEGKETLKSKFFAQVIGKAFMKKNLKAYKDDDPDEFLKRHGIVDGVSGLDFDYSVFMAYGTSNQIQMVVTYDVQVIKLLDIDYSFKFRQCAKTTAWGNGISLIEPETSTVEKTNIWNMPSIVDRGKILVLEETKDCDYLAPPKKGYDAYDATKNEFTSVISIDTVTTTTNTADKIRYRFNSARNEMQSAVKAMDETITVEEKSSGNMISLTSSKETRSYRIIVVVPDNADLSVIEQARAKFMDNNPDVVIEIRQGHGDSVVKETETTSETTPET